MKLSLVVAMVAGMVGCNYLRHETLPDGKQVIIHKLTDEEKFALLNNEAKKRNLRWKIFCTSRVGEPESFQADAEHVEAPIAATYVDQGRMDEWMKGDFPTEADAAYGLYLAIKEPETHRAAKYFVRDPISRSVYCNREVKGNWTEAKR